MEAKIASRNRSRMTVAVAAMAAAVAVVAMLAGGTETAQASFLNSCTTYCHGMPPRDAARKANPRFGSQSSAVLGNHQTHVKPAPVAGDCTVCHQPVAATDFGHQNGVIAMANSLKGYSSATLRAKYSKGVFFNQTSIPNLTSATCSNVNCHFEAVTPAWGTTPTWSATGATTATCGGCHGAPPAGTASAPAGGLAGSHSRHNVYYSGITNCQKCHPATTGFSHATSAGRALKVQGFLRDPGNTLDASATYSGAAVNYLPSRSATPGFGSCSNLYCHSNSGPNGTARVSAAPTWGSAPLTCGSCHAEMSSVASTAPNGSHYVHASSGNSGGPLYACSVCHTGYTSTTVTTATHVNKQVELGFSGNGSGTTYSKAAPITAGTAWGSCGTSKCHGQAAGVTWGGTLWRSGSDHCSTCHSSNAAGAVTASVPFYSTEYPVKQTANTNAKVGAHTSHLTSTDSLTGTLACSDCHGTVTLATATHMSGSTNFSWSPLATKNGALTPTYNAATGQCANVYCHGASMPGGDTTGTNRTPTWNVAFLTPTISAAACGSCHGFPPSPASGHPAVTLPATWPLSGSATGVIGASCSCHANINPAGNSYATIFVDKSLHMNASLEVSGSGCDSCHGYPPVRPGFKGTQNNWSSARQQNYSGGGGAHTVVNHVSKTAKPADGFANCSKCHNPADHSTSAANFLPKVQIDRRYRMETAKQLRYTSNRLDGASHVAGNCSNISCHFGATPGWNQR